VKDTLCTVYFVCYFYCILTMGKIKCTYADELKSKYSRFWNCCNEWVSKCLVYKPGTYMSVVNSSALDLWGHIECEKHKKAVRGETSSAKVTGFFTTSESKSDDTVLAAEGAFAFHTVKHNSSYKKMDCTSVLLKQYSEITWKFSNAWTKKQLSTPLVYLVLLTT